MQSHNSSTMRPCTPLPLGSATRPLSAPPPPPLHSSAHRILLKDLRSSEGSTSRW
jgi:hypothetical protein